MGESDVNLATTGYSAYPGNTNGILIALPAYVSALESSGGAVREFVNPKFADDSRSSFKSPNCKGGWRQCPPGGFSMELISFQKDCKIKNIGRPLVS